MRIVFLDIDGPMIPDQIALLPSKDRFPLKPVTRFGCYSGFSPYSVAFIRQLCKSMAAKIVTNSTHNIRGPDHIRELFRVNGLDPDEFLYEEPLSDYCNKDAEIRGADRDEAVARWVIKHHDDITGFVVIDDALPYEYDKHMADTWGIEASSMYGLTPLQLDEAKKKIMNRKKTGFTDADIDYFMKLVCD